MSLATGIHYISLAALALGLTCAFILASTMFRWPQPMAVMNLVWPVVALFGGPAVIWLYKRYGVAKEKPVGASVAIATCHCGAGCTLGDIAAEILIFGFPGILVWVGLGSLFVSPISAGWLLDSIAAFFIGIGFQYFAIMPMGHANRGEALWRAFKADTLSLAAWQIGMIGFMAMVQFAVTPLKPSQPEFWFAMQIAMLAGFAVAYPVNWWLLKAGIKEAM